MTKTRSQILHGLLLATSALVASPLIASTAAMAGGPTGGSVAVGSATITTPNANQTVINQSSKKALINWNDFSVSSGSSVIFNQPNSKSLTVNRVTGPNASAIYGELLANGSIWLINANGILFGHGSQINVGALLATTSDITDDDFRKNHNNFNKASSNANASVVNQGTITTAKGGSVVLSASHVSNEGVIQANLGKVVLGGASAFTVDMKGDNLLRYQITEPVSETPKDAQGKSQSALVSNSGAISANGGTVLMTARAAKSVQDNVINNTGMVEATSVSSHNGEIDLDAGPSGTVNAGGTLDASGTAKGQTGGAVNITGGTVNVADGAKINASGDAGGGTIQIGGGPRGQGTLAHAQQTNIGNATISADAITKGNGGTVTVWSDGSTSFAGSISAKGGAKGGNGGSVETSGGHLNVGKSATVNTSSTLGATGDWLLDPEDILIQTGGTDGIGGSNIDPNTIISALGSTNVTLEATQDIDIESAIDYASGNTLSLLAQHNIFADASIQNTGTGNINLIAGWDGHTTDLAHLADPGVYGNNPPGAEAGTIEFNNNVAVGSAGGITTVAGLDITLEGSGGYSQIGYRGAGGGDIDVLATGELTLTTGEGIGSTAQIGNGDIAGSVSGNITGNISIDVGDATTLNQFGGRVWVGNAAAPSFVESGNVTLVTGSEDDTGEFGGNVFADLGSTSVPGSGGDFTIGFTNSDLNIDSGDIAYSSPHAFTIMSVDDVNLSVSIQNSGSGNINVVAGWDGMTTDLSALTNPGVFGNNGHGVTIGGKNANENTAVGSAGGVTTVAGDAITLDASNGYSQIGYHGAGGGAINVLATGDLTLTTGEGTGNTAQIGNGDIGGSVSGNVTGDIDLDVSGTTTFGGGAGGQAWLGNAAGAGFVESGNVTMITGAVQNDDSFGGADTLGAMLLADLGTTANPGSGGNVTLGITDPQTDFINTYLGMGAIDYSSPNALTLLSTGNITLPYSIQNDGAGALTILAGWNPSVAPADVLTTPGAFGNATTDQDGEDNLSAGAFVWVVGAPNGGLVDSNPGNESGGYSVGDSGLGTSIGSKGGTTTIGGAQLYIEGLSGYAQIGYHGDGGTGAIDVIANGTPGTGGLTGINACFDGNANICVIGGRQGTTDENNDPTYAQIGNLGLGVAGTSSANINVSATGNIAVAGGGIYDNSDSGSDPQIADAYGMIGNGDASQSATQTVSGTINVTVAGQMNFASSAGAGSDAWLGNRTGADGFSSGNVTLIAGSEDDTGPVDFGDMVAADLGSAPGAGGNVTIGQTDPDVQNKINGLNYSSANSLTVLTAGSLEITGSVQNSGTGNITIVGGWDGTTLDPAQFTNAGVFGNNGGSILIGGEDAQGGANIGSAGGTTTIAAYDVALEAENGFAQIGFNGGGATGDINVLAADDVDVFGDNGYAQIGHGGFLSNGSDSGNIEVQASGDVTLSGGNSAFSYAQIGHGGAASNSNQSAGFSQTGGIEVTGSNVTLLAGAGGGSYAQIGHGGYESGEAPSASVTADDTGDITVVATSGSVTLQGGQEESYAQIGNGGAFSNDGFVDGSSIANTGNIAVTAENGSVILIAGQGTSDNNYAQIGNGGNVAGLTGATEDANDSGNIVVDAGSLILTGGNGPNSNAQIGNGGAESWGDETGNITVVTTGDVALTGGGEGDGTDAYAQIGNGGFLAGFGNDSGNIDIIVGGNLTIATLAAAGGSFDNYAQIGNGAADNEHNGNGSGDEAVGNISLNVGGTTTLSSNTGNDIWIGNVAQPDATESGSVQAITGDFDGSNDENDDSSHFVEADLAGGNFTLGITDPEAQNQINGLDYAGANTLTVLTAGSLEITGSLQNSGTGNITIVGGWDGTTLDSTKFTNAGVFGNNGGSILIGGEDAEGDASVGSAAGTTTILGDVVSVLAENGNAQIGYHGAGTGTINVEALDEILIISDHGQTLAQIGNGGGDVPNAGGTINVHSFGGISIDANQSEAVAVIGNMSIGGSQSGDITVEADNGLGIGAVDENSLAKIGNGTVSGGSGDASGTINVTTGSLALESDGDGSIAQIGNGLTDNSSAAGDIFVSTGNLSMTSSGNSSASRIGDKTSGDANSAITVDATSYINLESGDFGNAIIGNGAGGDAAGDISVISGASISLDAEGTSSQARIGEAGTNTSGNLTVTAANDVDLSADGDNSAALISNFSANGTVTGDIDVTSTDGNVALIASGAGSYAHIGLGNEASAPSVSGNITVAAEGGSLELTSSGDGSFAQIGNGGTASQQTSASGNITITASGGMSLSADSDNADIQIGNGGDGASGNFSGTVSITTPGGMQLSANDDNDVLQIGNGGVNAQGNSSGNISLNAIDGSIDVTEGGGASYIQIGNGGDNSTGSTSGDISLVAGQDISIGTLTSTDGGSYVLVGNGGNNSNQDSSIGFSDTGNISLTASNISLETGNADSDIQIGNGGSCAGASASSPACGARGDSADDETGEGSGTNGNVTFGGDISITATDTLSLIADENLNGVWIGNGGDDSGAGLAITNGALTTSGDINVTVGTAEQAGTLLMETGDPGNSDVRIGNGGFMAGAGATADGGITTTGDVNVTVTGGGEHGGSASLLADASENPSGAQIGNESGNGAVNGTINVNIDGELDLETVSDIDSALIGNSGSVPGSAGGNVTVIAQKTDGIGDSVRNDLPGGDFTLENLGTDPLVIDEDFSLASTHNLTVLTAGDIDIEGVVQNTQTSGGGGITFVAGWDGTTTNPTSLANSGVYGNNGGSVLVGGSGAEGDSAVGNLSGLTTIEGDNVTLDAENGFAQIGFHGATGGDIGIVLQGELDLIGGSTFYAQIGNGATFGSNLAGGNINIESSLAAGNANVEGNPVVASGNADLVGDSAEIVLPAATGSNGVGASDAPLQVVLNSLAISSAGSDVFISSPTQGLSLGVGSDGISLGNGALTLSANGAISQTEAIVAHEMNISTTSGNITLTNAGNSFIGPLTVSTMGSDDASIFDSMTFNVDGANVGGTLTLAADGAIHQSGAIVANGLNVSTTNGAITLTNNDNSFNTATLSTTGTDNASLSDSTDLTIASATIGGDLTLSGGGSIGQSGAIHANGLIVSAANGDIALTNTGNAFNTAILTTAGSHSASLYDSSALTVAGATIGGNLILSGGGAIGQSGAITANALNVSTTAGDIVLADAANAVASASLSGTGNVSLYDSHDLTLTGASAGGDLTLLTTGNLTFVSSVQLTSGSLLGVAGWDGTTTDPSAFTTATAYGNNGGSILIGATTGNVAVGSASGTTTLAADNVTLDGESGHAQIGENSAGATGDIVIFAKGELALNAGEFGTLIGNGGNGVTGADGGNVTITAQSLTGDVDPSIANDLPGGDFTLTLAGDDALTLASDADYGSAHNLTLSNAGAIIFDGSVQNSGSGNIIVTSGAGVTIGGNGAAGNVAMGSAGGTTSVTANNLLISGINGYAQIGYHAGGSGSIDIVTNGDVSLMGGAQTGYYAQIGNGGYLTSGSNSGAITINADGNISLAGGAGQEAYAQIGHGGAESNSNSNGYSNTGIITINGESVTLASGTGTGAYTQIGHGGYKAGTSLAGAATNSGDITINVLNAVTLTGNGADAYAQIGNGGDFVNVNAANGSSGTTSGDIIVAVAATPSATTDPITETAGDGADSYVQIGNGGNGENTPVSGATVNFMISGDVTVSDLKLAGSNTGADGYAQIGNGDSAGTGTGNVSGNTTIANNTHVTVIDGTAPGTSAMIGNDTGIGTVTGTVTGFETGLSTPTQAAQANGSVAATQQTPITPTDTTVAIVTVTPEVGGPQGPSDAGQGAPSQVQTPLEKMADSDGSNSEGDEASDDLASSVGQSLTSGGHKASVTITRTLIPGVLTQVVTVGPRSPHGVPPADEDYSSWGNEALWRW